jgi:dynein heavy chain
MAIRKFYYISEEIKPKKEAYIMAEKQHKLKNDQMQKKKVELAELESNLMNYKNQLEAKEDEVKNLEDNINSSRIRKQRALELFEGLSGEEQKWVYYSRILAKVRFFNLTSF